jgi:hypothetical protein
MLHASNRRRKLFIPSLKLNTGIATSQLCKEEIVYDHFINLLGQTQPRSNTLDWANLGYQPHDLQELEDQFDEEETKRIIMQLPNEKAPGPDGFIGLFYKKCWTIIRADLLAALHAFHFHSLRTQKFNLMNEANVVLIPKTKEAAAVSVDQLA